MQGAIAKLSATPAAIRHPGPELGAHNDEILGRELGLTPARLEELRAQGVV
jgi:formyl-CoA transferase